MTFLPLISGRISGIRALASSDNITALSKSELIKSFKASLSCIPSPIPIVAESSSFGIIPSNLWTAPLVSFTSTRGTTIRSGEIARVEVTLIFGTHVYTKSLPALRAARDDNMGAP